MSFLKNISILFIIICLTACKGKDAAENYTGTLTIYADANQKDFLNQFIPIFENIHPKSKLAFEYLDEQTLLKLYFADSINNMILSRDLSTDELAYAGQNRETVSKQYYFADDAIAIIGNKNSSDSVFNLKNNQKTIVISQMNSYYMQSVLKGADSKNIYALATPQAVMDYVTQNDAVGLVPFSRFSNHRDKKHQALKEKIKLLQLQQNDTLYKLSQATIADFSYPWVTHTVLVTPKYPQPFLHLFASFLFKDRTSKAILHYGLVSAKLPELKVELK
jgi:hypothetical protein